MRHVAAQARFAPVFKSGLLAACGLVFLTFGTAAHAQSAPETLRINVEPAQPGIRSITINKGYRPIISRDDKGVVIDTMGSDSKLPPCDIKLEVTLENSRVLHRDANICSGNTLVVDVSNDGKPGVAARVVGTDTGVAAGPVSKSPADSPSSQSSETSTPQSDAPSEDKDSSIARIDPPAESGGLEPLKQRDTPITAPEGSETPGVSGDLESIVRERIGGPGNGNGNGQPVLVTPREDRQWLTEPGNQPGSLSVLQHTVPQTDDRTFRAECTSQSGFAKLTFQQAPAGLQEGMPQAVRISAGDFQGMYNAFGSSASNEAGISLPEVNIEMTDPLWEAMIRESELSVSVEGLPAYAVSLKGSANPVRLFVATCSLPQQIVADGAATGEEPGSDLSCSELGRVRSVEAVRPGQIVFRNASRQPVDVHWIDYRGGEQPYARLEPGQILEQQTYVSHAWSVRGAGGECRGIYVTRTPYREVVIQGATQFGPVGGDGNFGNQGGGFGGQDNFGAPDNFGGQGGFQNNQFNNGLPAGPVPPGEVGGDAGQPGIEQYAAGAGAADYLCTAGIDLNVVFSPDGQRATVSEMGYGAVTLYRQGSPSTFYFESEGHVLKGQIRNATWSRPGLRDVFCARR